MKFFVNIFALFFCLPMLTGCGTLVHGSKETFRVISDPPGAIAVFSIGELWVTTCAVEKKRNKPFFVKLLKDGYDPYEIRVEEKDNQGSGKTTMANMLMLGSVIWESIDRISGANKELTPNPALVELEPADIQLVVDELLSERELDQIMTQPEQTVYR